MTSRCYLCEETRYLEKAHIIPVYLFSIVLPNARKSDTFDKTVLLCPTHHRCFDNFQLTEDEIKRISPLVKKHIWLLHRLVDNFDKLYEQHYEYAVSKKDKKLVDVKKLRHAKKVDKYISKVGMYV